MALAAATVAVAADFPSAGLQVDLDARKGVTTDDQGRVTSWKNQVGGEATRDFVGQPKGRPDATSGLPTVVKGPTASIAFRQQELLCHDEAALDVSNPRAADTP